MSTSYRASEHHFFETLDEQTGGFWSKQVIRTVTFTAEDYDEFAHHFQHMTNELTLWRKTYGRKASLLHLEVEAHPWIIKRIKDHLTHIFPIGHPYGDFSRDHTITLHLTDPENKVGTHYTLFKDGKLCVTHNK